MQIIVVPNSRKFALDAACTPMRVHVKAKPEKNAANHEIIRELSRMLDSPVSIVRGANSRKKTISVGLSEKELLAKLSSQSENKIK